MIMDRIQSCIWDKLCTMSGEEVAKTLTDWHGNQLLDTGLYKHMIDEGLMDDELELFEDDEEEEENYGYDEEEDDDY